jgi:hypothetical protein
MGAGDRGGDWSRDEGTDTWQFKGPGGKGRGAVLR